MGKDRPDSHEPEESGESGQSPETDGELDDTAIIEEMEPLQPYTTSELATKLDAPRSRVKRLLTSLFKQGTVEGKQSATTKKPIVWVRTPPINRCPSCNREFRVGFSHPVLGAVQFCPKCGTQIKR